MCSNWSSKEDEILIDFVRAHEALYNVKCRGYRKTKLKQGLWCEIASALNKTDYDCTKRWCYVRDYYIRRKAKPGTGSGGETVKRRSELLSFLDYLPSSQRSSSTGVFEDENPEENTQDSCEEMQPVNPKTEYVTFETSKEYSEGDSNGDKNSKYDNSKEDNNILFCDMKQKSMLQAQKRLSLPEQKVPPRPSTQKDLDETDLFFSSMAKIVKKLPRYEQAELRMQIGSLVGNAELNYISNGLPRPGTSASDYS